MNMNKLLKISNIIVLIIQLLTLVLLSLKMLTRSDIESLSAQIYSADGYLMNSLILDILIRKEAAIVVGITILFSIIKEIKMSSLKIRMLINSSLFLLSFSLLVLTTFLINAPTLDL